MRSRAEPLLLLSLLLAPACTDGSSTPGPSPGADSGTTVQLGETGAEPPPASTSTAATPEDTTSTTAMVDEGPVTFSGPGPAFCPEGVEPSMELGHGEEIFRPADEAIATLVHGRQGGYHIVIGLRAQGLDLSDWGSGRVSATLGGQEVSDHDATVVMNCDDSGEFSTALWVNLIFDDGIGPAQLLGQTVSAHAEFIDASNQVVTADADVTIGDMVAG